MAACYLSGSKRHFSERDRCWNSKFTTGCLAVSGENGSHPQIHEATILLQKLLPPKRSLMCSSNSTSNFPEGRSKLIRACESRRLLRCQQCISHCKRFLARMICCYFLTLFTALGFCHKTSWHKLTMSSYVSIFVHKTLKHNADMCGQNTKFGNLNLTRRFTGCTCFGLIVSQLSTHKKTHDSCAGSLSMSSSVVPLESFPGLEGWCFFWQLTSDCKLFHLQHWLVSSSERCLPVQVQTACTVYHIEMIWNVCVCDLLISFRLATL